MKLKWNLEIHVAHAMFRKNGKHYRARAYVLNKPPSCPAFKSGWTVCLDDRSAIATRDAVNYIMHQYERDGLEPPSRIVDHGRLNASTVDHYSF